MGKVPMAPGDILRVRNTLMLVAAAARTESVSDEDLADFIRTCDGTQVLAPFIDPTAWMAGTAPADADDRARAGVARLPEGAERMTPQQLYEAGVALTIAAEDTHNLLVGTIAKDGRRVADIVATSERETHRGSYRECPTSFCTDAHRWVSMLCDRSVAAEYHAKYDHLMALYTRACDAHELLKARGTGEHEGILSQCGTGYCQESRRAVEELAPELGIHFEQRSPARDQPSARTVPPAIPVPLAVVVEFKDHVARYEVEGTPWTVSLTRDQRDRLEPAEYDVYMPWPESGRLTIKGAFRRVTATRREPETGTLEAALRNDLLWCMHALARLAWPASIQKLFETHGVPSLTAEYQHVVDHWWPPKENDAAV
jgi:hypothetical protein